MTQPTISAERIEEMLAGLEGPVGAVVIRGDDLADVRTAMTLALSALRAQAQGSEAVAFITAHGNPALRQDFPTDWLADPDKHGMTPLYFASPPVQAQPQGVMVKALEWKKTGKVLWTAETFYGTYGIERQSDSIGHTFWCWFKQGFSTETVSGYNSDLAAAKSSAQSEHARNILSSLATPPAPVDGGVTDALSKLVDAVSNMRVPQNIAEAGIQVMLTLGPALENARAALTAAQAAVAQDETP